MRPPRTAALLLALAPCLAGPAPARAQVPPRAPRVVRIATFNASFSRPEAGGLIRDLARPDNTQARLVAEIIQRVAPDILLLNEFDFDVDYEASSHFLNNYLNHGQNGAEPIAYPFVYAPEVNTGVPSGQDLDNNGEVVLKPGSRGYGNDAFGYGEFPGQYGMLILSKYPIDPTRIREFRTFLWKDMPGALLPEKEDGSPWYSPEALEVLRLSSKNHVDVPVRVGSEVIHLLASHPTPPAFDGPEDRNGRRNHDEIRLWADYIAGGDRSAYLGRLGADPPSTFVILGDLNADPFDGDSVDFAIDQLLRHPKVNADFVPTSEGGAEASGLQKGANSGHISRPAADTADFNDETVGNLRVDYVLPSKDLEVVGGGVFWPRVEEPLGRLVAMKPVPSSDHRLVYVDVRLPAARDRAPGPTRRDDAGGLDSPPASVGDVDPATRPVAGLTRGWRRLAGASASRRPRTRASGRPR